MRTFTKHAIASVMLLVAGASQAGVNQCDTFGQNFNGAKLTYVWGSQYLKVGEWGKLEVDTHLRRKVDFWSAPAKGIPFSITTANLGTYVASRKGHATTGRVDNSYRFNSPGQYHMIAQTSTGDINLCLLKPVSVHGEPQFIATNVQKENAGNGDVRVNIPLSFYWAQHSQAAEYNKAKRIRWTATELCAEQGNYCIENGVPTIGTDETLSGDNYSVLLGRGRYLIKAQIDDGVTVKNNFFEIENTDKPLWDSRPPICPDCIIP